jgi:hypothetical protein
MSRTEDHTVLGPAEMRDFVELAKDSADNCEWFLDRIDEELECIVCPRCIKYLKAARRIVLNNWDRQRGGSA